MKISLALLALLALGILLLLAWPESQAKKADAAGLPALNPARTEGRLPGPNARTGRSGEPPSPESSSPRQTFLLQVLSSEDDRPLEHIGLYAPGGRIGQPSGPDGFLRIHPEALPPFISPVVWGHGRVPLRLGPSRPLPQRVHLQAADGALQVRLLSATPAWKVIRSLLQSRERPSTGEEAWEPRLEQAAYDLLSTREIPPGGYDLYVWIASPDGEIHSLARPEVRIESGRTTEIELDASLPPAPEPDS